MAETILDLIAGGADDAMALAAPEREPLTFAGLRELAEKTVESMNGLGIGRNDRVAIVLPNGPEMAAAFVAVGAGATTAPLNPAYRADEFRFYLEDLGAKALFVEAGSESPAIGVARDLGVAVCELSVPDGAPAGVFEISGDAVGTASLTGPAQADDIALILHTSGPTSRPKIVPLSQTNVCASARNIGKTLSLTGDDRCMNIMPLFHIHGLIAAVLSSLAAGGSTYCTPG
ncbi:MAG: AMP-binding protein, partial [Alphaproteobacteria bacterium]|nr:AMP-binding protein [Alphaproteobacteria bacterium]